MGFRRLLLPLLIVLWPHAAPSLTATAGFDGHYRPGTWVQVNALVTNPGPAIEAVVEVVGQDDTRYAQATTVPAHAAAAVQLYVPLDWGRDHLPLRLRQGEATIAETSVQLRPVSPGGRLIGLVGTAGRPARLTDLPAADMSPRGHVTVIRLSPDELPEQAGAWNSLDALVVDGDVSLGAGQRAALRAWVESGGQLIMAGIIPGSMADLAPAQSLGKTIAGSLPALGDFAATRPPSSPAELLRLRPAADAEVMLRQNDLPLIVRSRMGRGVVQVAAFAPSALAGWEGRASLWASLTASQVNRPPWAAGISGWHLARQALWTLPEYSPPPVELILGFSIAYALLAGPVNFLVLTRLRRRRWMFGSVTGLSALFTLGAWLASQNFQTGKVAVHELAVVQVPPGAARGRADVLIGVFAPRRGDYTLHTESALLRPLAASQPGAPSLFPQWVGTARLDAPSVMRQHESGSTSRLSLEVGELAAFMMTTNSPAPRIAGEVTLDLNGVPRAVGWVRNEGGAALDQAVLLAERGFAPLGRLLPGERREFDVVLDAAAPSSQMITSANQADIGLSAWSAGASQRYALGYVPVITRILGTEDYWSEAVITRRFLLLSALLVREGQLPTSAQPTGVALVGWSQNTPSNGTIGGGPSRTYAETLYIYELAVHGPSPGDRVNLPASLMTWQVLDPGGVLDPSPYSLYLHNEAVIFRFQPWRAALPSAVDHLYLNFRRGVYSGQSMPLPTVALHNWQTDEWDDVPSLAWDNNEINHAEYYAGPDGAVDARVSAGDEPVSLLQFEISLAGTR